MTDKRSSTEFRLRRSRTISRQPQAFEGEKRFDLVVRWQEPYRNGVQRIQEILIGTPNHRYVPVKFSILGRALKTVLDEARAKIGRDVTLPYDTHLDWAGEINELQEAEGRPDAQPQDPSKGKLGYLARLWRRCQQATSSEHGRKRRARKPPPDTDQRSAPVASGFQVPGNADHHDSLVAPD
jgi:hypothetical protein